MQQGIVMTQTRERAGMQLNNFYDNKFSIELGILYPPSKKNITCYTWIH